VNTYRRQFFHSSPKRLKIRPIMAEKIPANRQPSADRPKRRRGRPKWMPTEEDLKKVENLAARGLTYQQIADALGIHLDTLLERRKEFSEFSGAFQGRAAVLAIAGSVIFDTMTKSKDEHLRLKAAQYLLSRRGGWSEKNDPSLNVTIGGRTLSIEDQAKREEEQLEIYRWMTPAERRTILDIMQHAQRRMKGEEVAVLDVLPPLEGEIKVDGPPDYLNEPEDDGDDEIEE
jgi:hypothetical protein